MSESLKEWQPESLYAKVVRNAKHKYELFISEEKQSLYRVDPITWLLDNEFAEGEVVSIVTGDPKDKKRIEVLEKALRGIVDVDEGFFDSVDDAMLSMVEIALKALNEPG